MAIDDCREVVAKVYEERNRLVAFLASLYPASLERHQGADWDDEWRWVCMIDLPNGQASWHIHISELPLFAHVPREQGRIWDGHTTEEKYRRIEELSHCRRAVSSGDAAEEERE